MYRQHIAKKTSLSRNSTSINKQTIPTPSYGSLSGTIQRAAASPETLRDDEWLQLDGALGTRATNEIRSGKRTSYVPEFKGISTQLAQESGKNIAPIQAKLTIGKVGDKYEQEADRVAADVVQQINCPASVSNAQGEMVQGKKSKEEKRELQLKPMIQRGADSGEETSRDLESAVNSARGGGQPLESELQESMEQAMGADFSGVRVHTNAKSDQLNKSIQAKAFTTGQDVFFRQGEYNPGSRGGQKLIAHELTHVLQQNGSTVQRTEYKSSPTDYMDDNDRKSELLDDNFDEEIKSKLPSPTSDEKVEDYVKTGKEEGVILWRGTSGTSVAAIKAKLSAGGSAVNAEAKRPEREIAQKQISKGGVFPEYTASSDVTGFSFRHWLVVVKINTKYLSRGSKSESGWVCDPAAPVEVLDTVDRTCDLPEPKGSGAA